MTVTHDEQAGAWYLHICDRPVARTNELAPDILVDRDSDGRVIGVEILEARP